MWPLCSVATFASQAFHKPSNHRKSIPHAYAGAVNHRLIKLEMYLLLIISLIVMGDGGLWMFQGKAS